MTPHAEPRTPPGEDELLSAVGKQDQPLCSESVLIPVMRLGHLARALSARTGRGTDAHVVADARITMHNASEHLASIALHRYDAVVVSLGMSEALDLASVSKWRKHLGVFLGQIPTAGALDVARLGVEERSTSGSRATQ
jgi:hypothetical protein